AGRGTAFASRRDHEAGLVDTSFCARFEWPGERIDARLVFFKRGRGSLVAPGQWQKAVRSGEKPPRHQRTFFRQQDTVMANQKIRIRLKAYDHRLIDRSA